jgi:diguanylate cyclase (GGDEF)-like protein
MSGADDEDGTSRPTNPNETVITHVSSVDQRQASREGCLVIIYGQDLGRRVPLGEEPMLIGRSSSCHVQVDQESVSRRHAQVWRRDDRYVARDLGSTNGTYVNDDPVDELDLRDGDQLKIGRTIFKFIVGSNMEAQYHEEIYRLMTVDGLTTLHNKRYFNEAIDRETSRAQRYDRTFSLIVFDIDHFKKINDTHGHLAGDAVLRQLGSLVISLVRRDDIPARTGGEEFSVIVPEADLEGAAQLAEKLREAVEEHRFEVDGERIPVTISVGVAQWMPWVEDPQDLVRLADERLYDAKNAGRNRVCGASGPLPAPPSR